MKVFILTEAGQKVGFGHLSRCTAVYHAFLRRGVKPVMLVNGDQGISDLLTGVRHEVFDWLGAFQETLSRIAGADIVFIDSYLADEGKYQDIAATVLLIACVDDYKRIRYPQGVVVNGLIYAPQMNYRMGKGVEYLLGTRYAFLRKAFWKVPKRKVFPEIKNILMTFGGSDFLDLAPQTLAKVTEQFPDIKKTVVISQFYKNIEAIKKAADRNTKIVVDASDETMKRLMHQADAAVSASGQTLSELAVLGIPGVAFCVAGNQRRNWKAWTDRGFIAVQPQADSIVRGLAQLQFQAVRKRSSMRLRKVISPSGTFKVVDALLRKARALKAGLKRMAKRFVVRQVNKSDCRDIWLWRNTYHARTASFRSDPISYRDHELWFRRKINDPESLLWMAQSGGQKVGYVRHDIDGARAVNSVLLNPKFYGMGLGAKIIRAADQKFLRTKNAPRTICAEIRDHNVASQRAFRSAGYKFEERIVKNGKKAGVYKLSLV